VLDVPSCRPTTIFNILELVGRTGAAKLTLTIGLAIVLVTTLGLGDFEQGFQGIFPPPLWVLSS
jgi:hypothetical protein